MSPGRMLSPFLLASLCFSLSAFPQQPPAPRDATALSVIQRAVVAMGGVKMIGQIRDCVAEGTIEPSKGSWLTSGSFVWKNSGSEFRYENQGPAGPSVYTSGHGRPGVASGGKVTRLYAHVSEANFAPHLAAVSLLKALLEARYQVALLGEETWNGHLALRVKTSFTADEASAVTTHQEWLFDLASGLPLRAEYRLPANNNALEFLPAAAEFSDFRSISGVLVPFQIAVYHDGQMGGVIKLNSVLFNVGMSPTEFDSPAGGVQ